MFEVNVVLYAFNYNLSDHSFRLVSSLKETLKPISVKLRPTHTSISEAVKELIYDYLVCSIHSLNPRLFDVSIVDQTININFVTTTPIDLKLADSYYISVSNTDVATNMILKKALTYV